MSLLYFRLILGPVFKNKMLDHCIGEVNTFLQIVAAFGKMKRGVFLIPHLSFVARASTYFLTHNITLVNLNYSFLWT